MGMYEYAKMGEEFLMLLQFPRQQTGDCEHEAVPDKSWFPLRYEPSNKKLLNQLSPYYG